MTSRILTHLVLVLGLLSSISLKAQQVSFTFSPSSVSPNVGDVVKFDVVVNNFTNMTSFQYAHEWDPNLFDYVGITKGTSMPDADQLQFNNYTAGAAIVLWSANGSDKTAPNGTIAYSVSLKVKAASTNYWVSFSSNGVTVEVIKANNPVNPSFGNVGNPPGGGSTPVIVKTSTHTVQASQAVCVGVTADNFTSIQSAKWDMKWDSTVLRYQSLSTLNTTLGLSTGGNFVTTSAVANGRLSFNWSSTQAKTLNSGDTLYKVCFTAIGANSTSTSVSTLTTGSEILRSSSGSNTSVSLSPTNGTVSISSGSQPGTGLSFSGTTVSGNVGDTSVCVKFYAKNFKNIAIANWSMHWDSSKVSLMKARIQNTALGSQDSLVVPSTVSSKISSPNNVFTLDPAIIGSLRFLLDLSSNLNGVTLTGDSSLVFELCFRLNGGAGTTVPVTFNGIPLKISVLDPDVNKIPVTFYPGNIIIGNSSTPAINASGATKDVTCNSGNDGKVDLTVSGGTGTYTYSWSGPNGFTATTQNIATLKAGTYSVTISSGAATPKVSSFPITEPTKISASKTVTNVNCFGQSTGAITLTPSGGTSPYTYSWSSGETVNNIANKAAGQYIATITDTKGCSIKDTTTITQPASALSIVPTVTNPSCYGASNGSITLVVSGGTAPYTYSWAGLSSTVTTKDIANLKSGNYTVTVTDNNQCARTSGPTTLTDPTPIITITPSVTNVFCNGASTGAITITAQGGVAPYSYVWSSSDLTKDISNKAAGDYTVTATDANGCKGFTTAKISQSDAISITGNVSTSVIGCVGTITLNVTGGTSPYTYTWSGNGITNTTSKDQANLCPNETYTVEVKDANNCKSNRQFTVTGQLAEPIRITDSTVISHAGCPGQNLGEIRIFFTGGRAPYSFEWLNSASEIIDRNQSTTGRSAGKYRIRITDAIGQKYLSGEIEIKGNSSAINISVSEITNETCSGSDGKILLSVTGTTEILNPKYVWNDGPTSKDRIGVKAGTYSVTVMDDSRCRAEKTNINVDKTNCPLTVNMTAKSATCFDSKDGSLTVNITNGEPGYVIRWSATDSISVNNSPSKAASYEIKNLAGGSYTITITDSKNQRVTQNATITSSPEIVIVKTVKNDAGNCSGSIVLSITGGTAPYSYLWNDGLTPRDRFNLCANDIRSVTVTDSKGCFKSTPNDTIKSSTEPSTCATIRINTVYDGIYNLKCFGDKNASATVVTVTSTALTPPFQYRWDNGETGPTASQLAAGSRTVTVIGANGRTCNESVTIKSPDEIKVAVIPISEECALDAIPRGGVAPYSYKWSTPKGDTTQKVIAPLSSVSYYVLVKDKYGCSTDPGVNMVVCQEFCLQGPTVLTPNDDGKNDKYEIERCDYKTVLFQVYNRWGQLVYENKDYRDQWEGYNRDGRDGKQLPEGVYMLVLKGIQSNGQEKTVKSTLSLLRE